MRATVEVVVVVSRIIRVGANIIHNGRYLIMMGRSGVVGDFGIQ